MTPVTRRITNTKKNRLILRLRPPPHRIPPRHPIHRIVGVLQQIRAYFPTQGIGFLHPQILARLNPARIPDMQDHSFFFFSPLAGSAR